MSEKDYKLLHIYCQAQVQVLHKSKVSKGTATTAETIILYNVIFHEIRENTNMSYHSSPGLVTTLL